MSTTNLKDQLTKLLELQKVDSEIYALKSNKEAIPEELKVLEGEFETKKQNLKNLEDTSLDLQKQKKDRDTELAAKEEATKKLQSQLFSLKTNKEYQTMLQQIQDSKADASIIEDKILALFDQMDKVKKDLEEEKKRLQGEEKIFNEQKVKVQARVKEIDGRLIQLAAQRSRIIPDIDSKILVDYERILVNRDGLAIVPVVDSMCKGCNMFVPPQVINLIQMYEHIVTCEMCNRILYVEHETA